MQMNKTLTIESFPRIHITLIGMNNDGYRINGGIGFSIDSPVTKIYFELSKENIIIDKRENGFNNDEMKKLLDILNTTKVKNNMKYGISCIIESKILPHYGLGSGTSIYLSCIEALFLLNNISYDNKKIIYYSKRGGTSGIGINTYFNGGFVFDIGIKNQGDLLIPSSIADREGKTPLCIYNGTLPDWKIGICIPFFIENKSETEEKLFFQQNCPIEKSHILDILYESIYGITSSILEEDYNIFSEAIIKIQKTRWKYLERKLYGDDLCELEHQIIKYGANCVGMSSLGPTLYFTGEDVNYINSMINKNINNVKCYIVNMNNNGRKITYV